MEPCDDHDADGFVGGPGCVIETDCNDQDPMIHPGATETCNGWNDDCDSETDEGCTRSCPSFGLVRRHIVEDHAASPRLVLAEKGFALTFADGVPGFLTTATRLDKEGQEICPERSFTQENPEAGELVWTGTEMGAGWEHFRSSLPSSPGARMRRLGAWGVPPAPEIRFQDGESSHAALTWTGSEYAHIWMIVEGLAIDGTRFQRIAADGTVLEGDLYLTSELYSWHALAWSGSGLGWVYQVNTPANDLFFQKLDRFGNMIGPEVRITDHRVSGGFAELPRMIWKGSGRGYALIWADKSTSSAAKQIWFASLNEDGSVVTPPGLVQVSLANSWGTSNQADFAWTGEEYLVVWPEIPFPQTCGGAGQIKGARISEAGVILERRTIAQDYCSGEPRIAWNGSFFGIAIEQHDDWPNGNPDIAYLEVGCRCGQDADSDANLACLGDCNDGDPTIGATKPELCSDAKDNDCDGLVDCQDPACAEGGVPPGEIGGLAWNPTKDILSWSADPLASVYDVAQGVLSDLRDMENFRWAECLVWKTAANSVSDPTPPSPGEGRYFLVRGRSGTCRLGTWGTALREATIRVCP